MTVLPLVFVDDVDEDASDDDGMMSMKEFKIMKRKLNSLMWDLRLNLMIKTSKI